MALRRNDARRRRLVIDPTAQVGNVDLAISGAGTARSRSKKTAPPDSRDYSYGADRRNQHKTTDLIPKRVVSYLLVVLALLAVLWMINFTSVRAHQWVDQIGQPGIEALAIRGQGSLASWFTSFLFIMTALVSLQIYALRRHRCDDYRGTYRLWLWLAALLMIASVSCIANLGAVATNLVQTLISDSHSTRAWVPLAIKLSAITVLMGRGAYEVRESRGSFALVMFVWVSYSIAAVLQMPATQRSMAGLGAETMIGNCVLFGTTALFLAHLTYGRYIFLHAHGLIPQRVKKEKLAESNLAKPKRQPKTKKQTVSKKPAAKTKAAARKKTPTVVAEDSGPRSRQAKQTHKSKASKSKTTAKPKVSSNQSSVKPTANEDKSPSDVLKELAAASRAKEKSKNRSRNQHNDSYLDEEETEGVYKMSKSQRRKQRKMEKQRRRAA